MSFYLCVCVCVCAVLYVFTVQALYMNFPNIRRHYFWPDLLRQYAASVKRRQMSAAPITIVPIKPVDGPLPASAPVWSMKSVLFLACLCMFECVCVCVCVYVFGYPMRIRLSGTAAIVNKFALFSVSHRHRPMRSQACASSVATI